MKISWVYENTDKLELWLMIGWKEVKAGYENIMIASLDHLSLRELPQSSRAEALVSLAF